MGSCCSKNQKIHPDVKSVFLSYHQSNTILVNSFATQLSSKGWTIINRPNIKQKQKQKETRNDEIGISSLVICFITRNYLKLCTNELRNVIGTHKPIFMVFLENILTMEEIDENTQEYLKVSGHYNLFDSSNRILDVQDVNTIRFEQFFKLMNLYTEIKSNTKQTNYKYDYLFSYCSKNNDLVSSIVSLIKQREWSVYLNENQTENNKFEFEKLQSTITNGFIESETICFFLTKSYLETINVQQEIQYAAKLKKKCLIILLEENIDFSLGTQIYTKDIQIMNAFEKSYEDVHKSYYIFQRIIEDKQKNENNMEFEVPGNPVQIIIRDENGLLKINEDILSKIENLEALATIVIVGPYRTGKSYIMNRFLKRQKGFVLGGEVDACTEGIWMWDSFSDKKIVDGKEVTLLYFDTEGIDSPKAVSGWDIKLFTLALLMASFFIYNSKNAIGKGELNMITAVTHISEKIKVESKDNNYGNEGTDFLWSLRDFFLENNYDKEEFIGDKYLENILQSNDKSTDIELNIKQALKKVFRNIYCHTIKAPTNDEVILRNLDKYDWKDLDLRFRNSIDKLCSRVKETAIAKRINSVVVNGFIYADFLKTVVKLINENKQIDVVVSLAASIQHVLERNLDKAIDDYKNGMDEFIEQHSLPQSWDGLTEKHSKVYESCCKALAKNNFASEEQVKNYMILLQEKIMGKTPQDKSCLWQSYIMKNSTAIKKHNKGIIYKLYNEYVKSKQSTFKSDKQFEDALIKVISEYEATGFSGPEMIQIKEEFLKSIEVDRLEFKNQLQNFLQQQEKILEKQKEIEEQKRKHEEQQVKIKNLEMSVQAVKSFLEASNKQMKEKEQNFAKVQEKLKNWSKDEDIIKKEKQVLENLAKMKEEEIKRKNRELEEIKQNLKNMENEINNDKLKVKENEKTLRELENALDDLKN